MIFLTANNSIPEIADSENNNQPVNNEISNESALRTLGIRQSASYLTNREQEVLYLISEGFRTDVIARKLFISPLTVSTHRKNMIKKLHAKTTPHLVGIAIRFGLI